MPLAPSSLAVAAPVHRQADEAAATNWRANLATLKETQPSLITQLDGLPVHVTWLFGRDGSLTAQDAAAAWWAGCSVPTAAARAMLKTLGGSGTVAYFLRPPTAAAVRIALDKLRANQVIVAIVPDVAAAWVMLHCENFAADVRQHRLWLAIGEDWETHLASLLRENEGLPMPSQFVRLTDGSEEISEAMIQPAQRVISQVTQERAAAIGRLQAPPSSNPSRACIVAPTHFRLWDDAGFALSQFASKLGWTHVDPDDPASASPLAVARAAATSAAVVMPNTGRADLPNVVATDTPWITWLTGPRVPSFAGAGPRDALLVADPDWRDAAIAQGWPAPRVHVATWPVRQSTPTDGPAPLLIIADLPPLEPPKDVVEMSSQRLLWELIADELARDPFTLGTSILDYLHTRMKRLNIAPATLDQRRFIDDAVAPAYARGLAELLKRNSLPLRLAGTGWDAIESLASVATGPLTGRDAFHDVVSSASALIHVWPTTCAHPIDHQGLPVVRASAGRERFLRDAKLAVAGKLARSHCDDAALSAEVLSALTRS